MAVTDILVLATIVISMLFGAWRGLIKEALSLAFWLGAIILAGMFSSQLANSITFIDNPAARRVAAFILIFVITVFVGGLISNLLSKLTSAAGLKAVDRALGALFGILRGLVIVTLVIVLTSPFDMVKPYYNNSITVPYLLVMAEFIQEKFGLGQDDHQTVSS